MFHTFLEHLNFPEWAQLPTSNIAQSHSMHTHDLGSNNLREETAISNEADGNHEEEKEQAHYLVGCHFI